MRRLLLLVLALTLAACAGPQATALVDDAGSLPRRAEVAAVPFFAQEEHLCGPAALATVLSWGGLAASSDDLDPLVYTPRRAGSLAADMLGAARRLGRLAVPVGSLAGVLGEVAAGNPVLVLQNLSLDIAPLWHFAVVVGYDLDARVAVLRSGGQERQEMALDTFEHTWSRAGGWAVVVLPPDRLPATASELDVARAAAALERTGWAGAAARSYRAMQDRWPDSLVAAVGLGNALFAQGDRTGAAQVLQAAAEKHPESSVIRHNLDEVNR
ncbi:MAG: PA2778 family cysteine peptidase [Actinomycetota bacterium]